MEVFPFSFREYLRFKEVTLDNSSIFTTAQKGKLLKLVNDYIALGGIPDALKYPELEVHKTLYDDVLYRDIATRYKLDNVKSLQELSLYLISNTSALISFNKIKDLLRLGSVNTVKNYINYLESSWLFFVVNKYAYSVKEQQIAAKKIYSIDTGLTKSVGFSFSPNSGKFMENVVYLELLRRQKNVYYYKTGQEQEVDFFIPKDQLFIQVTKQLTDETKNREVNALVTAAQEQKNPSQLLIITESDKELIESEGFKIQVIPLYEWLLFKPEK